MSPPADVAEEAQRIPVEGSDINAAMNQPTNMTPGIEVREQMLNKAELGFLSGIFEAWANRTMTEADFRGAMELLLSQEQALDG